MSIYNNMHKYTGVRETISPNAALALGEMRVRKRTILGLF